MGRALFRVLRVLLCGWAFFVFFVGWPLIGLVLFPLFRLTARSWEHHRDRCTHFVHKGFGVFSGWMRISGLISYPRKLALPSDLPGQGAYVVIANHPSLIDVVLLIASIPRLTCVVKGSWYRNALMGSLLRATHFLPGRGSGEEDCDMLGAMVQHLQAGHPLLVFPEGTRSLRDKMHRFRRGAIEAAIRTGVPILPIFIGMDVAFLLKGQPFWEMPNQRVGFTLEVWDLIETKGMSVEDAKTLNRDLQLRFNQRFARNLEERGELRALPETTEATA